MDNDFVVMIQFCIFLILMACILTVGCYVLISLREALEWAYENLVAAHEDWKERRLEVHQ